MMRISGFSAQALMQCIKRQFDLILTAWTYLTRVPLPNHLTSHLKHTQHTLEASARYLPLIGVAVGALSALVFWGAEWALGSKSLAIILSMVASICLTGAFHEDGLADFFDAFGGGWWSRQRILEIMKDSRIGTFGALATVMAVIIKWQALLLIPNWLIPWVLVAAHAFSRFAAGSFLFTHQYVRANDESYFKPMMKAKMHEQDFIVMAVIGMLPIMLLGNIMYILLLPALWIIRALFGHWFTGKIGGYTGDCLGATQQVIELSFYLGIVFMTNLHA